MENERKKFNLFGFLDKDGKGVEKGDELKVLENPSIKNFFKLFWRKFREMLLVNMLYIFGNFPMLFALFAISGYASIPTVSPGIGLYTALKGTLYYSGGASSAVNSPVIASLNGIFGKQIITSVPTAVTYILYGLSLLTIFTFGLVNVGCTYVLRNMIRGEHIFVWQDFWYAVKKNIKQGIIYGVLDILIIVMLFYDMLWFRSNIGISGLMSLLYYVSFAMMVIYFFMRMYIYPMLITFDLTIFKLFKNAILFTVLGIKRNLMCLLGTVITILLNVLLFFAFMPIGIILPFIITIAFCSFMSVYCVYPKIKQYMIDPYYKEVAKGVSD